MSITKKTKIIELKKKNYKKVNTKGVGRENKSKMRGKKWGGCVKGAVKFFLCPKTQVNTGKKDQGGREAH